MAKRVVALFLWFYVTWMVWTFVSYITGLSFLLGPVAGAAIAALVVTDPRHKIWGSRTN